MKTSGRIIGRLVAGCILACSVTSKLFAQTVPQFTGISVTDEGAMQLYWASQSNEIYEIDEADALVDTNTGNITWNKLYDDYPSQGTNTFIGDFGNYSLMPQILHPKNLPMRFYRIVDKGPDDLTNDEPIVTIVSPTNGVAVSGRLVVTAAASSDQMGLATKLYVDGQEMQPSHDGSNYVVNTCEWGNGPHVLFATAKCVSALDGPFGAPASSVGHGVSPFVPVVFSNLVTRISFSQPFFEPSLGQTQQVSAAFAANVNWALNIRDVYSNAVRTVTGSGTSMVFNWDGTGNGGTNIPAGVYYYYISAQTNGQAFTSMMSGSESSLASSASVSDFANDMELWALPPDSSSPPLPLAIYPPGFDTNGFIIFEASQSEVQALTGAVMAQNKAAVTMKSSKVSASVSSAGFSFHANDASGGSATPPSQDGPPAPLRPPIKPVANSVGTIGIAYQNYAANGLAGFNTPLPKGSQGPNLGQITMENHGAANMPPFMILHQAAEESANFAYEMFLGAWNTTVNLANDQLTASALRSSGSGNPFNQVDLGLLIMHGVYGSSMDFNASGCKQMYFPVTAASGSQYVRMSEMQFGGSGATNGLKWMALMACSSLHQVNWQSMQNQNIKPYNSSLHMFLGADTEFEMDPNISQYWADYMIGDPNAIPTPRLPMPLRAAWYQAASDAYHVPLPPNQAHTVNPMKFATVYDTACVGDYLQTQTNTILSGSWGKDASQVYP